MDTRPHRFQVETRPRPAGTGPSSGGGGGGAAPGRSAEKPASGKKHEKFSSAIFVRIAARRASPFRK